MHIVRPIATTAVAVSLAASGVLFGRASIDQSPASFSRSTRASTTVSQDATAMHAATKAALVMMCQAGQHDAAAKARYLAAAATVPTLAAGITPDCGLTTGP